MVYFPDSYCVSQVRSVRVLYQDSSCVVVLSPKTSAKYINFHCKYKSCEPSTNDGTCRGISKIRVSQRNPIIARNPSYPARQLASHPRKSNQ
ncbi:hypothetical protein VTL71DRAFT_9617 [Oculimacula yallundae]|uniref:ZP domain-containing protein n=1 Tax=Oculimacula yallundae TaxID=86028 RepID=A0ABR4BRB8_9HELO